MLHNELKWALFEWHIFDVFMNAPQMTVDVLFSIFYIIMYILIWWNLIKSIEIDCMILFFIE